MAFEIGCGPGNELGNAIRLWTHYLKIPIQIFLRIYVIMHPKISLKLLQRLSIGNIFKNMLQTNHCFVYCVLNSPGLELLKKNCVCYVLLNNPMLELLKINQSCYWFVNSPKPLRTNGFSKQISRVVLLSEPLHDSENN